MIEIPDGSGLAFIYGTVPERLPFKKWTLERTECVDGTSISTLKVEAYKIAHSVENITDIGSIKCPHGKPILYEESCRLPHADWQELIEYWSCHNGEFKNVANLRMHPRNRGVLIGDFHLVADPSILADCCKGREVIYYNELNKCSISCELIIYCFFKEYFKSKNKFRFSYDGDWHEIKYFYGCVCYTGKLKEGMKIGIKKVKDGRMIEQINEYYCGEILKGINKHKIGIELLGYELSFICS